MKNVGICLDENLDMNVHANKTAANPKGYTLLIWSDNNGIEREITTM